MLHKLQWRSERTNQELNKRKPNTLMAPNIKLSESLVGYYDVFFVP